MSLIKYPYTNLHELNLDWLIEQLNNPDGPVRSVNGKSGMVTLTGEDIERSTSNPETVAAALQAQGSALQSVQNKLGTTPLPTTATTVTGAIAEHETDINGIKEDIGSTALPTTAQTLTGAIAENTGNIADIDDAIGSTALPTTAQTLTGAIAENAGVIANIEDDVIGSTELPTTAQTLTGAIAENAQGIADIEDNIGNTELPTTAQTLTGAIAENAQGIADIEDSIGNTALPTTAQTLTGAIKEVNDNQAALDMFGHGTLIPNNSDINNYKTLGKYYSPSTATTSTMTNAPTTGGFSLFVMIDGFDWLNQYASPVNGSGIYHRYYTSNTDTWSAWKSVVFE